MVDCYSFERILILTLLSKKHSSKSTLSDIFEQSVASKCVDVSLSLSTLHFLNLFKFIKDCHNSVSIETVVSCSNRFILAHGLYKISNIDEWSQ